MCYSASVFNVGVQRNQIASGSVNLTWAYTQSLFIATNTILWSLSYPEIRRDHPLEEVSGHLQVALEGLELAAERWPGAQSALHLYRNLITACLKAYRTEESFVVHSLSSHPSVVAGLTGWDPSLRASSATAGQLSYIDASVDPMLQMDNIGDTYSQYSGQPFPTNPWHDGTLSQQGQLELMDKLGVHIPEVSVQLLDRAGAFYRP